MQEPEDNSTIDGRILKMYQILEFKGKGAYGMVWKAVEKQSRKVVALKKVFDAFSNDTDAQRTYREVVYLKQLTQHENIIKLLQVYRAENMKDLYMTFEYVESDLHKVIRGGIMNQQHIQYVTYQMLKALKYIHSGDLIHRDLKPSNLLIDQECKIKLADFGLARSVRDDIECPIMTEYVATRWYRAPEILLGCSDYNKSVDMWSVGTILGEMFLGQPVFPGTSTLSQLEIIIELIGRPKASIPVLDQLQVNKRRTFTQFFKGAPKEVIDFIKQCLQWDPNKRMTANEALNHPYLQEFKDVEEQRDMVGQIDIPLRDNKKLDKRKYRDILYQMDKTFVLLTRQRADVEQIPILKLQNQRMRTLQDEDIIKKRPSPASRKALTPFRSRSFDKTKIDVKKTPYRERSQDIRQDSKPDRLEIKYDQSRSIHQIVQMMQPSRMKIHSKSRNFMDSQGIKKQLASAYFDVTSVISKM